VVDFKKKIFGKNAIKLTFLGYSKKYSKNKFGNMKVILLSLCSKITDKWRKQKKHKKR